jgi:hypothetical protein
MTSPPPCEGAWASAACTLVVAHHAQDRALVGVDRVADRIEILCRRVEEAELVQPLGDALDVFRVVRPVLAHAGVDVEPDGPVHGRAIAGELLVRTDAFREVVLLLTAVLLGHILRYEAQATGPAPVTAD